MSDEVRIAELVLPHQTNHYGTLFGGTALGLMDKAGFIAATRLARRTVVTVASERVEFKVPVRARQMVELVARVSETGRTSITTAVEMYVEDLLSGRRRLATSGSFIFVAIDEEGRPTPVSSGRDE
jgi:acyl-CoA hydrolase